MVIHRVPSNGLPTTNSDDMAHGTGLSTRFIRLITVVAALSGLVLLYARVVRPLMQSDERHHDAYVAPVRTDVVPEFSDYARRFLPNHPWVADAPTQFRNRRGQYSYFQEHELIEDNKALRVWPFAMISVPPDQEADEQPVTLIAESAILHFSSAIESDALDPQKMAAKEFQPIGASLRGQVTVNGPNGLSLNGRNFRFSDPAGRLWTDSPVSFTWGDHYGTSSNGAEVSFNHALESAGQDGMSVHSIRLTGRVVCNLHFEQETSEPIDLKIDAANGFEFDTNTLTATFLGHSGRPLRREDHVWVERPNATGKADWLFCSQLSLFFGRQLSSGADKPPVAADDVSDQFDGLELQRLTADGPRVVLKMSEQAAVAQMRELHYNVIQRQIRFVNRPFDGGATTDPVIVRQGETTLKCLDFSAFHDEDSHIRNARCAGPGTITSTAGPADKADPAAGEPARQAVGVSWMKSFEMRPTVDPQRYLLTVLGSVQLRDPNEKLALDAGRIDMRVYQPEKSSNAQIPFGARKEDQGSAGESSVISLNATPESLIARDGVVLSSPELSGSVRESLELTFIDPETVPGNEDASVTPEPKDENAPDSGDRPQERRMSFDADTLRADVMRSPSKSQSDDDSSQSPQQQIGELWLRGAVSVSNLSDDPLKAFKATGNVLHAVPAESGGHKIQMYGDPVIVNRAGQHMEAAQIDVDQISQMTDVAGGGRLRFVLDKWLDGESLETPVPVDIYWGQRMTFRDSVAEFIGDARVVVVEKSAREHRERRIELSSPKITVTFAGAPELRQGTDGTLVASSETKVLGIHCHSEVHVTDAERIDGIASAHREAMVSDLVLDATTKDFEAKGPGWIEVTQPNSGRGLKVTPSVVARANQPAMAHENAFVFAHIDFIESAKGNIDAKFATFSYEVSTWFGPVHDVDSRIDDDILFSGQIPEGGGRLLCDELTFTVLDRGEELPASFEMVANGSPRVISASFSGEADVIKYDDSKEQLILRATAPNLASVSYRQKRGSLRQRVEGERFEYYPGKNKLYTNNITGVQAAE